MPNFMIQTGDPSGTGKGGQSIWGGEFDDEIRPTLKVRSASDPVQYTRDRRDGQPRSEYQQVTSERVLPVLTQFFITYSKQPHLDGKYTIIGKVIDGAELGGTLEAMEKVANDAKHRPIEPIITKSVTIHANPIAQKALP
ncbi:peptidylprolyl isomerase [Malassezia yamatoensis]|uniref:Peptidyl-prolyl cis-trans isomerase-like 3 n=1 Tax=Malassezia yamatoensis TaxID=253288 RepID=A0AAJ6CH36_9BASI|nr:peptidylprolyl isomerase [Malassezia yamatoensis]